MDYDYAVIIGRFQPFHNGHLHLIQEARKIARKLIIVIGSCYQAPNPKNPFNENERAQMMIDGITPLSGRSTIFTQLQDHLHNDEKWVNSLYERIEGCFDRPEFGGSYIAPDKVCIIGHEKDAEWYTKHVTKYPFISVDGTNTHLLNATQIREMFFSNHHPDLIYGIPPSTAKYLEGYKSTSTEKFFNLAGEYQYLEQYKKQWAGTPYPVIFQAADSVVLYNNSVLMVKRANYPGKGLWALPGGFVQPYERLEEAARRELREETGLVVGHEDLQLFETFDCPSRDARGRVITTAYLYDISDALQPPVLTPADDAAECKWFDLMLIDLASQEIYSDHMEIIQTLTTAYRNIKS